MALLNRFSKLNDRGETGVFTFIVTKSVTRDLHRDATTKDFCFGYHRWAVSFQRPTDKMLGVHLLLRNASPGTACVVDFTLALLNREHFSQNQVYSKRQARFSITNPMQGVARWIELSELAERRFSNETGEFLFELSLSNMSTIFECDIQLNGAILNQYKQMLKFGSNGAAQTAPSSTNSAGKTIASAGGANHNGKHQHQTGGLNQLINLETNNFTFGSFEWSLTIVPLVVSCQSSASSGQPQLYQTAGSSQDSFGPAGGNPLDHHQHHQHHHHQQQQQSGKAGKHSRLSQASSGQAEPARDLEPVCRVYLNRLNGLDSLCRVKYRVILGHHQPGGAHSAEYVDSKQLDQVSDCGGRIRGHQFRHTNVLKLISLRHQQAACASATATGANLNSSSSPSSSSSSQQQQQFMPSSSLATPATKQPKQTAGSTSSSSSASSSASSASGAASSLDLRVHIEMFCANTISEARVPLARNPNEPQSSNCSDRNKQSWCVEADCDDGELLRLKLFFLDLQSVPRNHIRYISWIAHLVRREPKTGQTRDSLPVRNSPHSNYYLQDGIDLGAIMETDIQVAQLHKSPKSFLENNMLMVHIEWIDSLLLFSHLYNNYDALATVQRHQISRELCALQQEFDYLEGKYLQAQRTLNRLSNWPEQTGGAPQTTAASASAAATTTTAATTAGSASNTGGGGSSSSSNNNSNNETSANNGQRQRQQIAALGQRRAQAGGPSGAQLATAAAATTGDNKHQQRSNGRQSVTLNDRLELEDARWRATNLGLAGGGGGQQGQICLIGDNPDDLDEDEEDDQDQDPDDDRTGPAQRRQSRLAFHTLDQATSSPLATPSRHHFGEMTLEGKATSAGLASELAANVAHHRNESAQQAEQHSDLDWRSASPSSGAATMLQQGADLDQIGLVLVANRFGVGQQDELELDNGRCTSSLSLGGADQQRAKLSQNNYADQQQRQRQQHQFGRLSGGDLLAPNVHLLGSALQQQQQLVAGHLLAQSLNESLQAAVIGQPMAAAQTGASSLAAYQQALEARRSSSTRRRLPQQPNLVVAAANLTSSHYSQQQREHRPSSALLPGSEPGWLSPAGHHQSASNHHHHHHPFRISSGSFDATNYQHNQQHLTRGLNHNQYSQQHQLNKNELAGLNHRRLSPAGNQLEHATSHTSGASSSASIRTVDEDEADPDGGARVDLMDDVTLANAAAPNDANHPDVTCANSSTTNTIILNRFYQPRLSADSAASSAKLASNFGSLADHRPSFSNASIREQTSATTTATSLIHTPTEQVRKLSASRHVVNKQQQHQFVDYMGCGGGGGGTSASTSTTNDNAIGPLIEDRHQHINRPVEFLQTKTNANLSNKLIANNSAACDDTRDRLAHNMFATENMPLERLSLRPDHCQTHADASRSLFHEPDARCLQATQAGSAKTSIESESRDHQVGNSNEFVALPPECPPMDHHHQPLARRESPLPPMTQKPFHAGHYQSTQLGPSAHEEVG